MNVFPESRSPRPEAKPCNRPYAWWFTWSPEHALCRLPRDRPLIIPRPNSAGSRQPLLESEMVYRNMVVLNTVISLMKLKLVDIPIHTLQVPLCVAWLHTFTGSTDHEPPRFRAMPAAGLAPQAISFSATISACATRSATRRETALGKWGCLGWGVEV